MSASGRKQTFGVLGLEGSQVCRAKCVCRVELRLPHAREATRKGSQTLVPGVFFGHFLRGVPLVITKENPATREGLIRCPLSAKSGRSTLRRERPLYGMRTFRRLWFVRNPRCGQAKQVFAPCLARRCSCPFLPEAWAYTFSCLHLLFNHS